MGYIDALPVNQIVSAKNDMIIELPATIPLKKNEVQAAGVINFVHVMREAQKVAENHANSWRNFRVGAVLHAYDLDPERPRLGQFFGANIKPSEDSDINIHAEQMAIRKARDAGFGWIAILGVWGKPQEDHVSGLVASTLHPCGRCREMFTDEVPEIDDDTLIMSGSNGLEVCEIYKTDELYAYHEGGQEITLSRLDLSDAAIDSGLTDAQAIDFIFTKLQNTAS